MVIMTKNLFLCLLILASSSSGSNGQQNYSGNSVLNCDESDETGPSPSFLYTCNKRRPSCRALLMFRTQSPYDSVSSVANFTSSDPQELARLNNLSVSETVPTDTTLFVPVTCSCQGQYYQSNASYIFKPGSGGYFIISNNTFQGLTSCSALQRENPYGPLDLVPGLKLRVPLRCACPSEEQISDGTKLLLTFLITWQDSVAVISRKFNVSAKSVAFANGFEEGNPKIYPFTTILIPLESEPQAAKFRRFFPTSYQFSLSSRRTKKSLKWLFVGVGTGSALALFCFLLYLSFLHLKRKNEAKLSRKSKDGLPEHFLDKVVGIGQSLKIYSYEELESATDNFSQLNKLSGSIYLGVLRGNLVAVKKASTDASKEIKILCNLNHFNLISLYGVCENHEAFYLVYEYLEEGSLKDWLRRETSAFAHSWKHRFNIALDVANALDYLHNFTSPAHVHKDINSGNILLNRDLRAKLSNFSLARENGNSQSSCVLGERGYMAPEYVEVGEVTPKIDVYAFGVVLLELITGREAVFLKDGEEVLLSKAVTEALDGKSMEGDINGLIDPRLQERHPLGFVIDQSELASRFLQLSVACLAPQPANRLSMDEVVKALMKIQPDIYNPQSLSIEIGL